MKSEDRQTFRKKTLEGMDHLLERNPSGVCVIMVSEGKEEGGSLVHALGEFSASEILSRAYRCLAELAGNMDISQDRFIAAVLAAHFLASEQDMSRRKGTVAETSNLKCGHA